MSIDVAPSAEEIQRQMQSVRSHLRRDVKELVENAKEMADWHYYARRYPWMSVAAAAAVGFVLVRAATADSVPRPIGGPVPAPLGLTSPPEPTKPKSTGSLLGSVAARAGSAITQTAMSMAMQQLSQIFSSAVAAALTEPTPREERHEEPRY